MINTNLESIITKLLALTAIELPDDVYESLQAMQKKESQSLAQELYACIFDNLSKASSFKRPLCQDTGVLQFFVKTGASFPFLEEIEDTIISAVKRATIEVPLRHNTVECFSEKNTGNNTGILSPWIEWEIVKGMQNLHIDVYMAGGGCSLPGRSKVLMPLEGYEGVVRFVFDTIVEWGVNACPPLVVGVGIGTCAATAALLSKKAILRKVGEHNKDPKACDMEIRMKEGLDKIGIGPLGLTGSQSVQCVNIEFAGHHPATLGVGVTVGCWATRRGSIDINPDLTYAITSHKKSQIFNNF
ncbi:MAG: L(+)-tartrate dehydratase subunit alpha [Christensenellaceae bacterium]|nr:L(+)-tartrate dehydratase subunit alpha [Christensenellaceae bacterium]